MNKCACANGKYAEWSITIVLDYTNKRIKCCCEDCIRIELSALADERQRLITFLEVKKIEE